jgi:hypothetical protein
METQRQHNASLKRLQKISQYYFKNSGTKAKTDDPKVTGSLDVRINRK